MDRDDRELIVRLCTRAGMMMEDASVVAIGTAALNGDQLQSAVDNLRTAVAHMAALLSAADAAAVQSNI